MIDLSNVIALALGSDDVLQIQDAIGTVLWQKTIYYTVNISAGSNGTVSVNGVSGNYSQSVPSGTVLTIEGTGNTGYNFDEWSDGNTDNPRTITVTGDLTLTAAFESAVMPNYFYVEDISGADNTLSIKKQGSSAPDIEVFCSSDQKNWTSMGTTSTTAITATVPANGKLYLRATANKWGASSFQYTSISASRNHNVGGNIMSLLYNEDFENQTLFPAGSTYTFFYFFKSDPNLINAENLVLPATTLTDYCYGNMFNSCSSLTAAPALPATTLAQSCYQSMFYNCSSLTAAPVLPATTLAQGCYQSMFENCTSLTTAPELPATTLATSCYNGMFYNCTSLTTAPELPVTTLATSCYYCMFLNCTSLTQAPALPAQSVPQSAYSGMFRNCTSLVTAPTLSATTLANNCYKQMFWGCSALTETPALPATTLANYCYSQMFWGCSALTETPELPATTLAANCYQNMFSGCTNLNSVVTYAQDISANKCLLNWLSGVAATGDFYNMACTTYPEGASGIPSGWTEHHTTASTINVTITNTGDYTGATYQIDSGAAQPINETGTTSFTVPATATTLTIHRNGKGVTDVLGICGYSEDSDWDAAFPVNKMTDNVSVDIMSLM